MAQSTVAQDLEQVIPSSGNSILAPDTSSSATKRQALRHLCKLSWYNDRSSNAELTFFLVPGKRSIGLGEKTAMSLGNILITDVPAVSP